MLYISNKILYTDFPTSIVELPKMIENMIGNALSFRDNDESSILGL